MQKGFITRAFSLIELLLTLAILGIVAAIIVPKYLNMQQQAYSAIAGAYTTKTLNDTLAEWQAAGGTIGSKAMAGAVLYTLSSSSPVLPGAHADPTHDVSDGGASSSIRLPLPPGTPSPALSSTIDYQGIRVGKMLIFIDWAYSKKLYSCSTDDIGMPDNTQLSGAVGESYNNGVLNFSFVDVNGNQYPPKGNNFTIKE